MNNKLDSWGASPFLFIKEEWYGRCYHGMGCSRSSGGYDPVFWMASFLQGYRSLARQDYLPRLEQQMDAAEAAVYEIDSVDVALQLVVQIELSEINEVFSAAIAATDAAFVKKLGPFQKTMEAHMTYIVERIPELSPKLMLACRELRARFPKERA